MASRAPIIEVVIRDEVTAAMERMRRQTRSRVDQQSFKGITTGIKSIEEGVRSLGNTVQRELGSLLRLTGAGAFLGGGVIAGIAKATQALSNLARSAEQTRYMADQLGITEQVLKNLTARGQALGMSAEQTKTGLTSLATNLRELKVLGQNAAIYKQLVATGGASGRRFGDQLIAQVRGPGGIEDGIKQFATSLGGMNAEAQAKLAGIFGTGSVAFRDLYSKGLKDLPRILELPEGQARRLNIAMARLNIQFDNMKVTLGSAVIPMFEQLTTTVSKFLQGPGGKLVKQAADWFKGLNIDWKALGDGFIKVVGYLKDAFIATYNAYLIMDPIVQGMGGWTPILLGLAAAIGLGGAFTGRVGLVGALAGLGAALVLIGRYKDVIPGLAALGGAAAGAAPGGAPGGSGGTSSPIPLPGVTVTPPPRTRMPMPMPRPSSAPGGDTSIPANAKPVSFGSGRSGYYIPGYSEEPDDNDELRKRVAATRVQVASLAAYIGAQAALTDESGAGGLAALGGAIRGGGGSPPGGGGNPPSGSTGPRETGTGDTPPRFANVRLNNPGAATAPAGSPHRRMAELFGSTGGQKLPGGGYTPAFPSPVGGAAFNMWFLTQKKWLGRKVSDIIWEWSGHNRRWAAGFRGDEVLTPEMLNNPEFMIKLAKGIAAGEAPGKYPMDDKQWEQAFRWYQNKGIPEGEKALPRTDPKTGQPLAPAQQPQQPQVQNNPPAQQNIPVGANDDGPSFRTKGNQEVDKYVGFERAIAGLSPEMHARLMAAYRAMPPEVRQSFVINEGWRSYEYQNYLRNIKGVRPAAPPGTSRHEGGGVFGGGIAVDVDNGPALAWLHKYGHLYGLEGILGGLHGRDPGHIQLNRSFKGTFFDPNNPQRVPIPGQMNEKARQAKAQEEFDTYLKKQREKENEDERPSFASRARASRIKLNINVRGPRGVKTSASSDGDVGSPTINRSMDPTGGRSDFQSPA